MNRHLIPFECSALPPQSIFDQNSIHLLTRFSTFLQKYLYCCCLQTLPPPLILLLSFSYFVYFILFFFLVVLGVLLVPGCIFLLKFFLLKLSALPIPSLLFSFSEKNHPVIVSGFALAYSKILKSNRMWMLVISIFFFFYCYAVPCLTS